WPSAQVALEAEVEMLCQRCMRPMRVRLGTDSTVLFADTEQAAEGAPEGSETFLAAEGRISLAALIGEELLLALPIVPRHETGAQCEPSEGPPSQEVAAGLQPVTRPFADLRALLERGGKQKD
ncbi:MAG TPA: YceD family protein, partial [Steroidobacteraceae bacterium]|nr:YceD family protein [Steroidobacteraceae bacterium]